LKLDGYRVLAILLIRWSLLVPANFYFIVLRVAEQDADRSALIVLPNH
jgi:hypothetical protein